MCGRRRTSPQFSLVMKASLILSDLMRNIMFFIKTGKTEPEEVSERWWWGHALGNVLCSRTSI